MHSCVSGHYRILLLSSQPGYWVGCIECTHRYVTQSVRSEVDDMLHVAGLDRRYKEFGLSRSGESHVTPTPAHCTAFHVHVQSER